MHKPHLSEERAAAVAAALEACRLCRSVQEALVAPGTITKVDKSPVTVADFGAQAVVNLALGRRFADDAIVAEEEAAALRSDEAICRKVLRHVRLVLPQASEQDVLSAIDRGGHAGGPQGRFWTLDPIDGTKGFLRAEQYAVALALIEEGEVVLGVLGCPNLPVNGPDGERGALFIAVKGQGTVMRSLASTLETPIHVSTTSDPAGAAICESVESGHSDQNDSARVAARLGVQSPPVRMDSQAKYAAVARGDAEIYLRLPTRPGYEERIWDHAAGCLVVTEAGGAVTDVLGRSLDFSAGRTLARNKGVVATNGVLHDRVVAAVREVRGE
jgi:3'(2'), 5'-bisphosphate nucleotidase